MSEENVDTLRAVYDELHRTEPAGLRYATFRQDDGVSFVHVAQTEDGVNPLSSVEAFARFQDGIGERCEEAPVVTVLHEVGSYRAGGESPR